MLSIEELARLQTFPNGYQVVGNRRSAHRQIGNAVPSALGELLGLEILRQLFGEQEVPRLLRLTPARREDCPTAHPYRTHQFRLEELIPLRAPDIVFPGVRVIVFVDGDFWHGKNWQMRKARLAQGHNANYWIRKIERNVARDRERSRELRAAGWLVLRVWESEGHSMVGEVVRRIESALRQHAPARLQRGTARSQPSGTDG